MHDRLPGLVLGYHGCDRAVGEAVISGSSDLKASQNAYDWLGHGIYFWEYNPGRAMHYARMLQASPRPGGSRIVEPMVIGAVIDLGFCLNLLDAQFLNELPGAFDALQKLHEQSGTPLPQNRKSRGSRDLLLRHLDCAVIETLHQQREDQKRPSFDSARGAFVEGDPIYRGAGIHRFNHIQVCIRNSACVKGYFRLEPENFSRAFSDRPRYTVRHGTGRISDAASGGFGRESDGNTDGAFRVASAGSAASAHGRPGAGAAAALLAGGIARGRSSGPHGLGDG